MNRSRLAAVLQICVPAALVALWWFASADSKSFYFPPLADILQAFKDDWLFRRVPGDLAPSLARLLAGYALAIAAGVSLGLLIGLSPILSAMTSAVLDYFRSMPSVVLIPFGILVFGIGTSMKVFVIAFGAVWPILLNTVDGVRGVDGQMLDMARSFQIGRRDRILRIILPAASPQIFAGMRASLSIAVIMMVISEMMTSTDGVGFAALQAQRSFAIKEMWASILLLGLLGYVLNLLFDVLERRALGWHRGMRVQARQT